LKFDPGLKVYTVSSKALVNADNQELIIFLEWYWYNTILQNPFLSVDMTDFIYR